MSTSDIDCLEDSSKIQKPTVLQKVCLDIKTRVILVLASCLLIGIALPLALFYFVWYDSEGMLKCDLEYEIRFNCFPGLSNEELNETQCREAECCWDNHNPNVSACYHRYPSSYDYFIEAYINESTRTKELLLVTYRNATAANITIIREVGMKVVALSATHLRLWFYDFKKSHHEAIFSLNYNKVEESENVTWDNTEYSVEVPEKGNFYVKVKRKGESRNIFNNAVGTFVFCDQYIEISTILGSFNVFGLGQQLSSTLKLQLDKKRSRFLFSREAQNAAGVHPFYLCLEETGKAHGVLLVNSNPMEIITSSLPSLTYRVLGGDLNFHIFLGSSPEDIVKQVSSFVGKPAMPPYWALGYHVCRTTSNLTLANNSISEMYNQNIPQESDCVSALYTSSFCDSGTQDTTKTEFCDLIEILQKNKRNLLVVQHPQIRSSISPIPNECKNKLLEIDNKIYKGSSGDVLYPDVLNPNVGECLNCQICGKTTDFGMLLNMNTPFENHSSENKCSNNNWNNPPYVPNNRQNLTDETICMDVQHLDHTLHYDVHNIYGYSHHKALYNEFLKKNSKRPFISSFSTFTGSGRFGGHWGTVQESSWETLKHSLVQSLEFALYSIPLNGNPVCGFTGHLDEKLCSRWMQMAAFQPLMLTFRGEDKELADPVTLSEYTTNIANITIRLRYSLLPYLYTLFYFAYRDGSTVVRPLWFQFPKDPKAVDIDEQFLWGSGLMISPIVKKDIQNVRLYFPKACWYDFYDGKTVSRGFSASTLDVLALENKINIHVLGGSIIPSQTAKVTISDTRNTNLTLTVAMDCTLEFAKDKPVLAYGSLFIDDGESRIKDDGCHAVIEMKVNSSTLHLNVSYSGSNLDIKCINGVSTYVETVRIFGVRFRPSECHVDNEKHPTFKYDDRSGYLEIKNLMVNILENHTITWK
ncbi:lysosomal alpha-glucosidase-like [Tachypleus tridentatus]|uniref:lysosomal alpha-glucosidase-like n=1 Tax=Tachypleus tridentatus TaxID=6853 RepID=UPI003FD47211